MLKASNDSRTCAFVVSARASSIVHKGYGKAQEEQKEGTRGEDQKRGNCSLKAWCSHALLDLQKKDHNKLGHATYIESMQHAQEDAQHTVIDPEDETFDDPSHIQNIVPQTADPRLDPT